MNDPLTILKKYWGFDAFRPLQRDIVDAVLRGEDVLALLPTGGGKSICFQVPGLIIEGLCLVVTPLIALMRDQVSILKKKGIKAEAIYSGMRRREIDILLDNCAYGDVKFLYVSPERLETDVFKSRINKLRIELIAVDEAHCISQWGYDFRPSYLRIAELRKMLKGIPVIALTATATPEVITDIQEKLEFQGQNVLRKSFFRSNLSYSVREVEDPQRKLLEVLNSVQGSAIVYVNTRRQSKEVAMLLHRNGISTDFYHAGLEQDKRDRIQRNWKNNKSRVMVSTNAFGMGIDKPDVRIVVHLGLNQDLESYFQEAGRAGRDEKKAYSLILFNDNDVDGLKQRVLFQHPSIARLKQVYQALSNYFRLAVGSGLGQSFDFDIREFSENYSLNHLEAFYSLKRLEEEGLIGFNESYFNPSHIHIAVDHNDLYKFQVANANFDPLIKGLLRLYGGEIFTHFVVISESHLAKFIGMDKTDVIDQLSRLNELDLIHYELQRDKPQITFSRPRESAESLSLNKVRIKQRANLAAEKSAAVINYVKHNNSCRSRLLLQYFGEQNTSDCGICDLCLMRKKENSVEHLAKYKYQLLKKLQERSLNVEEVMNQINPSDRDAFLEVIRNMVDSGELVYDDQWRLIASPH
ncbi:MAG: ATP-dependent DNA helicase RecQ [Bacteroidota bacterium]